MHGHEDWIVPIAESALLSVRRLKKSTLKICPSLPHGTCRTYAQIINPDLLAFAKS